MLTRWTRCRPRDDAGFTMIEVVVAMLVFALVVSGILGVALNVFDVSRANTHRVAAANLATKQIETTRSMRALDIPDGAITRTEQVAGTVFTIRQTANYVVSGEDTSICQGNGDQLAYKLVTVDVTWPNMGNVAPVRSDTIKALGLGSDGLASNRGSLAIAVTGATGAPVPGVVVTLTPGNVTRTTGVDGCAVFVGLAPNTSYTASAGQEGFVGHLNTRAVQVTQGVLAGRITRATLLYDQTRTLTVAWNAPAGHAPAPGIALRYRSNYVSDGAQAPSCVAATPGNTCVTAVPGAINNLYPAVYQVSAGTCQDSWNATADADVVAASRSLDVPLAGYRVYVRNLLGAALPGRVVTAQHAPDTTENGCTGESYVLPATGGDGRHAAALPFGTWTFSTPGALAVSATRNLGDGVVDVELVVVGGS